MDGLGSWCAATRATCRGVVIRMLAACWGSQFASAIGPLPSRVWISNPQRRWKHLYLMRMNERGSGGEE
jgi:hypothetical protein